MKIISRKREIKLIKEILSSNKAELTAIWGRRRVGKTFLIDNVITSYKRSEDVYIRLTGIKNKDGKPQSIDSLIANFKISIINSLGQEPVILDPDDIFIYLTKLLKELNATGKRLILFLDEFPWLCEVQSEKFDFYQRFEHLWNNVLESTNTKVFICGSAASWMLKNIVYPKNALAKRITNKINLRAFKIKDTNLFLREKRFDLSKESVLELQMLLGGIPYYLDKFDAKKSLRENIYNLVISKEGLLSGKYEYDHLFNYLFSDPDYYKQIINILVSKRAGFSLQDLAMQLSNNKTDKPSNKLQEALSVLTESEFIAKKIQFANRKKGIHYFLIDEYIRFYHKFVLNNENINYPGFSRLMDSQAYHSWQGFNFELLCYRHYTELSEALGISGLSVNPYMFYLYDQKSEQIQCQIDLLLERSDNIITICEAKFYSDEYALTEDEYNKLIRRKKFLQEYLKSKRLKQKDFNFCLVHCNEIKRNKYLEKLNPALVSADCLFD